MKEQFWIGLIALTLFLTACNTNGADIATTASVVTAGNIAAAQVTEINDITLETDQSISTVPAAATDVTSTAGLDTHSLSVENLVRVMDGQVVISTANVRQGPGTDYQELGTLHLGQLVDVLAIDPQQDWVLIKSSGLIGWVSLNYMALFDSPDDLPVVLSATPAPNLPLGEIAPIFAVSGLEGPDA